MSGPNSADLKTAPDWWAAWFDADYSWDGLVHKPWRGWVVVDETYCAPESEAAETAHVRDASLQDYWRADPDDDWRLRDVEALKAPAPGIGVRELESFAGRDWHIAHLPPALFDDDQVSWKDVPAHQNWEVLRGLLAARLHAAGPTLGDRTGAVLGPDQRAQFDGVVATGLFGDFDPPPDTWHLTAAHSLHFSDPGLANRQIGSALDFSRARFVDGTDFDQCRFALTALFNDAQFVEQARFTRTHFGHTAQFARAAFQSFAWFSPTRFTLMADFSDAQFHSLALFDGACFAGDCWFTSARFSDSISLSFARFLKRLDLRRGRLTDSDGRLAAFGFSEVICLGPVNISDRHFASAPDFSGARFHDIVEFHRTDIHEDVRIFKTRFSLDPELAQLDWDTLALKLSETGPALPSLPVPDTRDLSEWYNATQAGHAAEKAKRDTLKAYHDAAFSDAHEVAETRKEEAEAAATAAHAQTETLADQFDARYRDGAFWRMAYAAWADYQSRPLRDPDHHEAAFRRLKLIMRGIGSHIEEQRFFALELRARQKRDDVAAWERWAAAAYGGLADYGRSAVRPLAWLAGVWAGFTLIYAAMAGWAGVLPPLPAQPAASYSYVIDRPPPAVEFGATLIAHQVNTKIETAQRARQMAGPAIFALELTAVPVASPVSNHVWSAELNRRPGWSTAFSFVRLINRIVSVPLIFLFALSLRRRFQLG
jgi:hypothetical protein